MVPTAEGVKNRLDSGGQWGLTSPKMPQPKNEKKLTFEVKNASAPAQPQLCAQM
jgi:hypothetical protein